MHEIRAEAVGAEQLPRFGDGLAPWGDAGTEPRFNLPHPPHLLLFTEQLNRMYSIRNGEEVSDTFPD